MCTQDSLPRKVCPHPDSLGWGGGACHSCGKLHFILGSDPQIQHFTSIVFAHLKATFWSCFQTPCTELPRLSVGRPSPLFPISPLTFSMKLC